MAEKKNMGNAFVAGIMKEAKAETLKESRKVWVLEVRVKMKQLSNARKIVANIEREIEDLEIRIAQESV